MQLKRPLAFFDIEGTGLDLEQDRIVELSICRYPAGGGHVEWFLQRFNPDGRPMSKKAAEVTGIHDSVLVGEPLFAQCAAEILAFLDGCDLAGFNLFQYDIPLLDAEFRRVGGKLDLEGRAIIDAGNIFKKKEERTLAAAVKFYTGKDLVDAHTARADVQGTAEVFFAQLQRYPDLAAMSLEEVGLFSRFGVDLAGKFGRDEDGRYIFNFGKHKGQPVEEHMGFLVWMLGKDFTPDTKAWARRIMDEIEAEEQQQETMHMADVSPFGGPY